MISDLLKAYGSKVKIMGCSQHSVPFLYSFCRESHRPQPPPTHTLLIGQGTPAALLLTADWPKRLQNCKEFQFLRCLLKLRFLQKSQNCKLSRSLSMMNGAEEDDQTLGRPRLVHLQGFRNKSWACNTHTLKHTPSILHTSLFLGALPTK